MGEGFLPTDHLERERREIAGLMGRLQARDLVLLEELDRRQVATRDGCRNLSEWLARTDDVSRETARRRVRTTRRIQDRADFPGLLASGEVSFDRVEALSRIPEDVGLLPQLDVAAVHREAWERARLTAKQESKTAADNYLFFPYTLDQTSARLRGGWDGYAGALVEKTISEAADDLPAFPGPGHRIRRRRPGDGCQR